MPFASGFSDTPAPPCYAAIVTSLRNGVDAEGYDKVSARMMMLAAQRPGYPGVESVRDADGVGITVSDWRSEVDILSWKHQVEHAAIRDRGRRDWYSRHHVRVAKVERAYDWFAEEAS